MRLCVNHFPLSPARTPGFLKGAWGVYFSTIIPLHNKFGALIALNTCMSVNRNSESRGESSDLPRFAPVGVEPTSPRHQGYGGAPFHHDAILELHHRSPKTRH